MAVRTKCRHEKENNSELTCIFSVSIEPICGKPHFSEKKQKTWEKAIFLLTSKSVLCVGKTPSYAKYGTARTYG